MKTIWCLFAIEEPHKRMLFWWSEKPPLDVLARALFVVPGTANERQLADVKLVHDGQRGRAPWLSPVNVYLLEEVKEGLS